MGGTQLVGEQALILRLFVDGHSRRSADAERAARALLDRHGGPGSALEVVDVFEEPSAAEAAGVLATPTLIRMSPPPQTRVIGGLNDQRLVARLLDLPDDHTTEGPQ